MKKVMGLTTDFPTRRSNKGTENPREFDLGGQWDLIIRTYTGLGKQTLGGHKQNLVCTRT